MPQGKRNQQTPATISEEHFTRLARVARTTRQDWAKAGMVGPQHSPYELAALYEVVAYGHLRQSLSGQADVVWAQLRTSLPAMTGQPSAELVLDLHLLRAAWVTDDTVIASTARAGHDVRAIDIGPALAEARIGFDLTVAASALARPADQLAPRRAARKQG